LNGICENPTVLAKHIAPGIITHNVLLKNDREFNFPAPDMLFQRLEVFKFHNAFATPGK